MRKAVAELHICIVGVSRRTGGERADGLLRSSEFAGALGAEHRDDDVLGSALDSELGHGVRDLLQQDRAEACSPRPWSGTPTSGDSHGFEWGDKKSHRSRSP